MIKKHKTLLQQNLENSAKYIENTETCTLYIPNNKYCTEYSDQIKKDATELTGKDLKDLEQQIKKKTKQISKQSKEFKKKATQESSDCTSLLNEYCQTFDAEFKVTSPLEHKTRDNHFIEKIDKLTATTGLKQKLEPLNLRHYLLSEQNYDITSYLTNIF